METLEVMPTNPESLRGGVYWLGEDINPWVLWNQWDFIPSPTEEAEIKQIGHFPKDDPVFFVTHATPDGEFHAVKGRFSQRQGMKKGLVRPMVGVNMDPLIVTADGFFVLSFRGANNTTNPGMVTLPGSAMNEDDFKTLLPFRANCRRTGLTEQGLDIDSPLVNQHGSMIPQFAVRDVLGLGLSFVAIVRTVLTKSEMEELFAHRRNSNPKVTGQVFVPVGSELPAEDTEEWTALVGAEHAGAKQWEYLPELLSAASKRILK